MAGSTSTAAAVSISTRASSTMTATTTATLPTTLPTIPTIPTTSRSATSSPVTTPTMATRDLVGFGGGGLAGTGIISPSGTGIDKGILEPRARCSQCGRRRTMCHHHQPSQQQGPGAHAPTSPLLVSSVIPPKSPNAITNGALSAAPPPPLHPGGRPRRISKLKHRALTATFSAQKNEEFPPISYPSSHFIASAASSAAATAATAAAARPSSSSDSSNKTQNGSMEPPVLSFYGKEPVPLPTRFAHAKRALVAGHEKELEASWARLIEALREEVDHIASRGSHITPSIDFADIGKRESRASFQRDLKRYGLGVVRGVVPRADAQISIDETVKYLERQSDFKEPTPQDPTCFDFFWTPAQIRTRAHPNVLQAQRFAMGLWENDADDRMATRFPIAYADRLRIHGANIGGVGPDSTDKARKDAKATKDRDEQGLSREEVAQRAALELELLGDFASSTVIAQVDNGSLERWEPDGYGRGGTYKAVFEGRWEDYEPWDPTFRVSATSDLYNGYGSCSIFRMYQGVVALSTIEPGLIRLLPSPKLATAYFLLRPFFSPKSKPPERRDGPEWEAFLDPSNWALDKEQSTIIHGAVPGHAQRLTELWHPHLYLRKTLVTIPTLQTGDYIVWHPDLAYHITSNPNVMASRAPTPPPMDADEDTSSGRPVSILVYVPAAPLTQNNALYLARQRKTFQRGHPSPDFDSTGSGLGSEATHVGRFGETDIAGVGGPAGLQAMGLAPFDVAPTPPTDTSTPNGTTPDGDVEMTNSSGSATPTTSSSKSVSRAEAEVARLANIILFPDRYDFYMPAPKRTASMSGVSDIAGRKRSRTDTTTSSASTDSRPSSSKQEDKGKAKEASPVEESSSKSS
ncbi:hypothetical protein QBC43DRAFT_204786 [Cladorrhinum sp. PSN259]|nr:hypothetical protein QBC43DRAFT_204786 [Cladorrhinum sp. PSN259]